MLGGHVQYWNAGVGVGMAEYLLCALLSASCFFCVALCLAEMTSTLPFGGGLYGFVRVTMGPYLGFLVGCCEIVQSISYPTAQLIPASHYLAGLFGLADEFSIVFFIIMIWTALAINLMGMKVFWRSNTCMIIISMSLLLVYYAAAMPCMDCDKYGRGSFVDSGKATEINDWFRGFPYSTCFFAGLEMLPLSCADATQVSPMYYRCFGLNLTPCPFACLSAQEDRPAGYDDRICILVRQYILGNYSSYLQCTWLQCNGVQH